MNWPWFVLVIGSALGWSTLAVFSHAAAQSPILLVVLSALWCFWICFVFFERLPSATFIWSSALLLRFIAFFAFPVFENDWIRYLWDGWMFRVHGSPYDLIPLDYFGTAESEELFGDRLDSFGYPEVPTIYGPVAMVTFAFSALIAPAHLWALKAVLALAELLTLIFLRRLLPLRSWALYALCPLPLFEIWVNVHLDALAIALAIGALFCLHLRGNSWRRTLAVSVLLGLAVACRVHALPLIVIVAWWYRQWRLLPLSLVVAVACYAPFWWSGSSAGLDVSHSFVSHWWYNAFILLVAEKFLSYEMARWVLLGMAGGLCCWLCWRGPLRPLPNPVVASQRYLHHSQHSPYPHIVPADWLYGILLVVGPVLNPWYLLWLLPFALARREGWTLALIIAASCGYANVGNLGWFTGTEFTGTDSQTFTSPISITQPGCRLCSGSFFLLVS